MHLPQDTSQRLSGEVWVGMHLRSTKAHLLMANMPVVSFHCMYLWFQTSCIKLAVLSPICCSVRGWYLFQYRLQGPAAFTAPSVWHDAKGAHVVAASHDGQVCADTACWPDRQNVSIGFLCAELHIHSALMFATTSACSTLQHYSTISARIILVKHHQTVSSCFYKHCTWFFVQHVQMYLCCVHAQVLSLLIANCQRCCAG